VVVVTPVVALHPDPRTFPRGQQGDERGADRHDTGWSNEPRGRKASRDAENCPEQPVYSPSSCSMATAINNAGERTGHDARPRTSIEKKYAAPGAL
jgi:hypothetical protein